jgi:hypothetical protein
VKEVVRDRDPEVPVTVIVEDAAGVDAEVEIVRVDVQVGRQDAGEKEAVAPDGRPEAEKETDEAVPETRVAVTVLDTDWPWTAERLPPLETEKSNVGTELLTVTVTDVEVVWFPAESLATAVRVWEALLAVVVFQDTE